MVAILTLLLFMIVHRQIKSRPLRLWIKSLQHHRQHFDTLFSSIDGFALSKQARISGDAPEYCYGEIVFMPFIALLSLCKINENTVFYDLGSGVGKAVIACAMMFDAKQCIGVELFSELHQAARLSLNQLKRIPIYAEKATRIVFRQGDLRQTSLVDAGLIFINASAFFGALWTSISQHCEQIPSGALVITTSKPLHSNTFSILKQTQVEMSWGIVIVYIQERDYRCPVK